MVVSQRNIHHCWTYHQLITLLADRSLLPILYSRQWRRMITNAHRTFVPVISCRRDSRGSLLRVDTAFMHLDRWAQVPIDHSVGLPCLLATWWPLCIFPRYDYLCKQFKEAVHHNVSCWIPLVAQSAERRGHSLGRGRRRFQSINPVDDAIIRLK
jgi:hypothetical protein